MAELPIDGESKITAVEDRFDYKTRLQREYIMSQEAIERLRPLLWDCVEKAETFIVAPRQREALALYAKILDWKYFGQPGDPLPKGLVVTSERGDTSYDSTIPYMDEALDVGLSEQLEDLGLGLVRVTTFAELTKDKRVTEVVDLNFDILLHSPQFAAMAGFDHDLPHMSHEKLTQAQRAVREAQIEQSVRAQYGLVSGEMIIPGSAPGIAMKRSLYGLDDETAPRKTKEDTSTNGVERFKEYLKPFFKEELDGKVFDQNSELNVRLYDKIAQHFVDHIGYSKYETVPFLNNYVSEAIAVAYSGKFKSMSEVMREAWLSCKNSTIHSAFIGEHNDEFISSNWERTLLLDPTFDSIKDKTETDPRVLLDHDREWARIFKKDAMIVSDASIERMKNRSIGNVAKFDKSSQRVGGRIVVLETGYSEMTTELNPDMSITLYKECQPFVPGYVLVGSAKQADETYKYDFVKDENGDPYTECNIEIDKNDTSELANIYASIGLGDLADSLQSAKKLTISDLAMHIQRNSVYAKASTHSKHRTDNLWDFKPLVENGKLHVQCTGAAQFLMHTLNELYGSSSSGIVTGDTTLHSNWADITAAGHAQVSFNFDDEYYILDATPSASGRVPRKKLFTRIKKMKKPAKKQNITIPEQSIEQIPEVEELVQVRQLEQQIDVYTVVTQMIESCEALLVASFEQPNNKKLYETLKKLPEHDVVRRTYELLRRYRLGKISTEDLSASSRYIKKIATADEPIQRKLRLQQYPQPLMEQLVRFVDDLERLDKQVAFEKPVNTPK